MVRKVLNGLGILMLLLAAAGCNAGAEGSRGIVYSNNSVLGYSIEFRPIELEVIGRGREKVLFIASIHGNEKAGTPLVAELSNYLKGNDDILEGKSVLIVPIANPDGYDANTRFNIMGTDLNRNFPTGNRVNNSINGEEGLTDPESQILYDLINKYKPARIVTIHQPLACIDYDGPAGELAAKMSSRTALPVKKLGSKPGSLGTWAGVEKHIPVITLELRRDDSQKSGAELWELYGDALLAAIEG